MAYIPMEQIVGKHENIYRIVLLASRRAMELSDGAVALITGSKKIPKLTTIALEEIKQGKVDFQIEEKKATKKTKK